MSDSDDAPYSGNGFSGEPGRAEVRSMPFFPAPPGSAAPAPVPPATAPAIPPARTPQHVPLSAPPPPSAVETISAGAGTAAGTVGGRHSQSARAIEAGPAAGPAAPPSSTEPGIVPGRIKIEDTVVEKIAALATMEIGGVAGLGDQGVTVHPGEDELTLDLAIVVEYGSVVMDVARAVQANVGRIVALMLGIRIAAVHVTVEDVIMPDESGG